MGDRIRRWALWSVLFSLLPFVGAFVLNWLTTGGNPQMVNVLGTGQLLLTSIAILAACVKDLSNRKAVVSKQGLGDSVNAFSTVLMLFMTASYSYINSMHLKGELTPRLMEQIGNYSIGFLTASIFIAGTGVALTDSSASKRVGAAP